MTAFKLRKTTAILRAARGKLRSRPGGQLPQRVGMVRLEPDALRPLMSVPMSFPDFGDRGLQIGQPALCGKADKLGIRLHAGLGLDEIVIILHGLDAEIEI
jgi:hypothetical protein